MRLRMDSSDSDTTGVNLLGRQRPVHSMLGGGKVADILLWENKRLSTAILIGTTVIWLLVEFMDYSFVTLLCHSLILAMLAISLMYNAAGLFNWTPPNKHDFKLPESTINYFFAAANWALVKIYDISCGKDVQLLAMIIPFLLVLSAVGTYISSSNLLYLGCLCVEILPILYERYKKKVDELATKGKKGMKKLYRILETRVLDKIPRGPSSTELYASRLR